MYKYAVLILTLLVAPTCVAGKKQCQPYLEKLRNIQAQQKVGHSNKKARALAQREQKARDKWWQCQQGKLAKKPATKTKAKTKRKAVSSSAKITPPLTLKPYQSTSPNSLTDKLVIKGEFTGQQQQDWLDYYQPLDKCRKPDSTQLFAFCMAERRRQRNAFVAQYDK